MLKSQKSKLTELALPVKQSHVVIVRRKMTVAQYERVRRAARKMLQDVRKFYKRKSL
jgi:hypothetical protein